MKVIAIKKPREGLNVILQQWIFYLPLYKV